MVMLFVLFNPFSEFFIYKDNIKIDSAAFARNHGKYEVFQLPLASVGAST
jgi:hypothetical protein